jgi:hypothetical protein
VLPPSRPTRVTQRQSLRQEYEEYILLRIEEYKEQLSREKLLAIADDAVRELEVGPEGQLVLTEVLVREYVDRLILRRLNLPTFRRWRERYLKLREAQREPTHWGLEPDTPLRSLARRTRDADLALIVGGGAVPASFLLAAHDWPVLLIASEPSVVEGAETRAAAEVLANRFRALVVSLNEWFPDVAPTLVVLDVATLGQFDSSTRTWFLDTLKGRTPSGGVHFLDATLPRDDGASLAADMLRDSYHGWQVERGTCRGAASWFLAVKP